MINPNEAPEGYEAVEPKEYPLCDGCCFFPTKTMLAVTSINGLCTRLEGIECTPAGRKDQMFVIFKEKKHE